MNVHLMSRIHSMLRKNDARRSKSSGAPNYLV